VCENGQRSLLEPLGLEAYLQGIPAQEPERGI